MQIIRHRRALHQIPELDRQLPRTLAYLRAVLGPRAFSPMEGALAIFFDFGAPEAIAFRADMDALPGLGHACGHDGHMAILLELAAWLRRQRALPNNVLLLFQPAEETTGGAKDLCETGILEAHRVKAIFGLHIWPGLPAGQLFTKAGPMMAGSAQIDVEISARGGHIALPGPNALTAGAELVCRSGCSFGRIWGGTAGNARAQTLQLQGSLRWLREDCFASQRERLLQTAREVEKKHGCKVLCKLSKGYPPVKNPGSLVKQAARVAEFEYLAAPTLLSEDFSFYQQRLPGLYFFLGGGDGPELHSPDFDFPEAILEKGAAFWKALAASPVWQALSPGN